jgi:hypothetical protein
LPFPFPAAYAHLGGSIVGTVLDNTNQQPLYNVSVTLKTPAKTVLTNALGKYRFENLAAGPAARGWICRCATNCPATCTPMLMSAPQNRAPWAKQKERIIYPWLLFSLLPGA